MLCISSRVLATIRNKFTSMEFEPKGNVMKKCQLIAITLLLLFSMRIHAEEGWNLAKDADGIKVYTRPVPGSASNEFKGVADIDAPLEVVVEIFKDIPSYTQWYGFCKEIKLLKQDTENHRVIYFVLKTMGPVKDRDFIVDTMENYDRQVGKDIVALNAVKEDLVPRKSKYVRMTDVSGSYVMTRIDPNRTHVVYTVKADPAGYIPAFVSNVMQKDQPYLTLKGLREMTRKDDYYQKAGMVRKP